MSHKPIDTKSYTFADAEILEMLPCGDCGQPYHGEAMNIAARCHPHVGVRALYKDGILYLSCHRCEAPIVALPIAGTR